MAKRQLEVCVDSLDSAIAAVNGGADRLELCAALSEGGLTPSPGLLFAVRKHISKLVDVFCIVRPRAGPMVYSEGEAEIILHDAATLKKAGADGLVFGALTVNGTIDRKLCKSFREVASDLPCTFHRAFDLLQDPLSELETVIELGYQRILTSGGKATALEGCDTLAQLVTAARGRIVIMVGAGVKSDNVGNIISLTGVSQCHASARVCRVFGSEETNGAKMGSESDNVLWVACQDEVRALKKAIGEN
ncbi:copper homeostasis protein cutC homolog [Homarus americanus]|uniref:Copper homeostasis protein cutC homolog n=1 Tax=Homarus americanus TaxID=6706 RepID=A0A8J5MP82_HOMAM|nr:copper homeostasis protein cutC homolog [Homarus americanus]XP_042240726.1 copper homeostasis protein cutC homolog [Homarus americanus]KAG7158753.1 Copper homeostasis protein cutC-like [Homarus americanus]